MYKETSISFFHKPIFRNVDAFISLSVDEFGAAHVSRGRWDLSEGELSMEAKVFKTNPNSRDLKGWSCVCIGIFHESRECLGLLLEHGGDPMLRSSYNKNAWDLAKVVLTYTGSARPNS
jgi:hypothetical protein